MCKGQGDESIEYYRQEVLTWLDRCDVGGDPLLVPTDQWHYYQEGLVGLHFYTTLPIAWDTLLADLSNDFTDSLFDLDSYWCDSHLRYQDGECLLRESSPFLKQIQRSFELFNIDNDFFKFHRLDLDHWEGGKRPLFYNLILKLTNGRDLVEEVRHTLTLSRLARTTIMTCYGPLRQTHCGSQDCLITFDSTWKSEEIIPKISPLFPEISLENMSCLPYHHWDVDWTWVGGGSPTEGFGPTGIFWEYAA
jgi:hypothetical protein